MNSTADTRNNETYSLPTAIFILIFGILTTITVCVFITVSYPVVLLFDKRLQFLNMYANIWARWTLGILPGSRFYVVGSENLPEKNKAVIYVANHASQTDILAVLALGQPFRFIAKKVLFKVPLFGWALSALGYVAVDRQNIASRKQSIQTSRELLKNGVSMLFYPEGTRSSDGKLKPFKMGAFSIAKEAGVDIVPITLVGTHNLLHKGSLRPHRTDIKVVVHRAIPTATMTVQEIAQAAATSIASALPQCDSTKTEVLA